MLPARASLSSMLRLALSLLFALCASAQAETRVLGVVAQYTDAVNVATPAQLSKSLFTNATSSNVFYIEGSGGAHAVTGDVIPTVVTVQQTRPTGSCVRPDYNLLADAIRKAGYALENYKVLVLSAIRSTGGCGQSFATKLSYVEANTGELRSIRMVLIWGAPNDTVLLHELLHTEGLGHANRLGCSSVALGPYCTKTEYGNPADIMGGSGQHQTTNAFMRRVIGWGSSVTHKSGVATYTIGAAYTPSSLPNALFIETRPPSGVKVMAPITISVEYRAPLGFDTRMLTKSALNSFATGAMINVTGAWEATSPTGKKYYSKCSDGSCLLDMTPGDNNHANGALQVGSAWVDQFTGVTIAVVSRTDKTLTVTVSN